MTTIVPAEDPRRVLARLLLLQKAVLDYLQQLNAKARKAGEAAYRGQEADVVVDGDLSLGRVYREKDRVSCYVDEGPLFQEWARINRPEQIETEEVETVTPEGVQWLLDNRPEFVRTDERTSVYTAYPAALAAQVKRDKGQWTQGPWTDPLTGEERDELPPFVKYTSKPGNLVVTPSDDAEAYVRALLSEKLPEIER